MPFDMNAGPLVLGASGKLGRALRYLHDTGHTKFAVPPVFQYRANGDGLLWDPLKGTQPEVAFSSIILLAGVTSGDDLHLNTDLAQAACQVADGARVLIASTQAVYGPQVGTLSEDHPCQPSSAYGTAKLAMEIAVAEQPNVTCMRIGNVVGSDALTAGMERGAVVLDQFADGRYPQRAMIGPLTLGHILEALVRISKPLPQILNLAQPELIGMDALLDAAGVTWTTRTAPDTALTALEMDLTALQNLVDIPTANAEDLITEAQLAGWKLP